MTLFMLWRVRNCRRYYYYYYYYFYYYFYYYYQVTEVKMRLVASDLC